MKIRIIKDYTDEWGTKASVGMTGRIWGDGETVSLDGFEKEKEEERLYRARFGEGANVVPWLMHIPDACWEEIK